MPAKHAKGREKKPAAPAGRLRAAIFNDGSLFTVGNLTGNGMAVVYMVDTVPIFLTILLIHNPVDPPSPGLRRPGTMRISTVPAMSLQEENF